MERERHWEDVYETKPPSEVSWYAPRLHRSLGLIRSCSSEGSSVLDVGGGASTLVDDLLEAGYRDVAVLDISPAALAVARGRLGDRSRSVEWLVGDIAKMSLPAERFDVWHDRAVFHFLTDPEDRAAYARNAHRALKAGGHVVLATFAPDGPSRCSGLATMRYDGRGLAEQLPGFQLLSEERDVHVTPGGAEQRFVYAVFTRS